MRKTLMLGAVAATLLAAGNADAAKIFNVNGSFSVAGSTATVGTLTGSFTTNDTMTAITALNLTTTAGSTTVAFIPFSFQATTYTLSNVTSTFVTPVALQLTGTSPVRVLQLGFSPLLGNGTSTITVGSFESQGFTRLLSGTVTAAAVPEPASWAMMLVGFGLVAGAARHRRKRALVTFA